MAREADATYSSRRFFEALESVGFSDARKARGMITPIPARLMNIRHGDARFSATA